MSGIVWALLGAAISVALLISILAVSGIQV